VTTTIPQPRTHRVSSHRPAPPESAGVRSQARSWARTTPGWLRLTSIAVAVLIALTILAAELVTASRQAAARRAQVATAHALIDAQTIYTSLSAADTAAAESFLPTVTNRADLETLFHNEMALAATSLASATQHAGSGSDVAAQIHALSIRIPIYTAIVATARANDRAGQPVGTAYLSEANNLMATSLLPAAEKLYRSAHQRLESDYRAATNPWPFVLVLWLFFVTVIALLMLQWRLSLRFNRTLNPAMVGATVLVLGAALWFGFALHGENGQITIARRDGSNPITAFTEARILAQRLRADDELTLVTRDAVASYQPDYDQKVAALTNLVGRTYPAGYAYQPLRDAASELAPISRSHDTIRAYDAAGKLLQANQEAAGGAADELPARFDRFDANLASAVAVTQANFSATTAAATDDLAGIFLGLAALGLVAIALVLWGAQQRIEEYR
jgi:hypothetical protein